MSSSVSTKETTTTATKNNNPTEHDPLLPTTSTNSNDYSDNNNEIKESSFVDDIMDTIKLAVPIFLAMVSWTGMKTTDTSLLGHVNSEALAASALSDLWTMCTGVLIRGRILGILCGSAIGANNPKLAGIYLQVSLVVLASVAIFVFLSWYLTEYIWIAFGSDPEISNMAGYYAKTLAWSIPGQLAFSQISQFFSAQRIMHPEVNASAVALVLNLILGLIFVLGIIPFYNSNVANSFQGYGFKACPIVTTCVVYAQFFTLWFIYIHIKKLHLPCWDGWKWKEITWDRIRTFSDLYFPAAFGLASDFWRVAVVGAVAAKFGEVDVAVFNTSYRIMWIVLIVVSALSSAAGIKMSIRLGEMDPLGAKQAGLVGIILAMIVLFFFGIAVLIFMRQFGMIFTQDEEFLNLFEKTRWPFAATLVLMNLSVAIERIPYTMGRTKEVFWMGFVASWGAQVPAVIFLTKYWRFDLVGLYSGMAVGYFVLALLYGWIAVSSDWKKYAEMARGRSEVK